MQFANLIAGCAFASSGHNRVDQCSKGRNEQGGRKTYRKHKVLEVAFVNRSWMGQECPIDEFCHWVLLQPNTTPIEKEYFPIFLLTDLKLCDIFPFMKDFDKFDLNILRHIQLDASQSIDRLADAVGLSRNACWRRMKKLEDEGVIDRKVAILNPEKLELGLMVYVLVKTLDHEPAWLSKFKKAVQSMPAIVGAHRMSGSLDYVLRVRVADVKTYDQFYQRLIDKVPIGDVSASFVMEDIKDTTALPL